MRVTEYQDDILGSRARLAVLRALLRYPWKELTGRELASVIGARAYEPVRRAVKQLEAAGILVLRAHGKAYAISLNRECAAYAPLKALFDEEGKSRQRFVAELKHLVPGEARCCLLFGSVARGEETAGSDVDLLLVVANAQAKRKAGERLPAYLGSYALPLSWHLFTQAEFRRERGSALFRDIGQRYEVIKGKDPWQTP